MTDLAIVAALDMIRRLTRRRDVIMATETGTDHVAVIDPDNRCPDAIVVAIFAYVGGQHMGRALAWNRGVIVATEATRRDGVMIEVRGDPSISGMA